MNKYRNIKTGGYDSKREAKRAAQLELMEKAGIIFNLEKQVKFELQPAFRNKQGVAIRRIEYICDFVYYDVKGEYWVAEDSKGFRTKDFILKSKMFQFKHPEYLFIET